MSLNLMTLTRLDGQKVEVNPAAVVTVETFNNQTRLVLVNGEELIVTDPQTKIRDRANYRAPDGFG